jgi:hypothetical protein
MDAGFYQAYITSTEGVVKIRLALSRHIKVKTGQYFGPRISKASSGSFSQIHPYELHTANKELRNEDDAMDFATIRGLQPRLASITGPHGLIISLDSYEAVVIIASGYGIASQLPYLKQAINGYRYCKNQHRRVHLVLVPEAEGNIPDTSMQLLLANERADEVMAAMPLLSLALAEDALEDGYVLPSNLLNWIRFANNQQILST